MSRILAIDFGEKRTGLAVTDPLQLIAGGLTTVETAQLEPFLLSYVAQEAVERFVIGNPKTWDNRPADISEKIDNLVTRLQTLFPNIAVSLIDERFTSALAVRAMVDGGMKKKARRNKAMIDQISATIILQSYLESQR
ncbi:MAG: Holliday junction resolvase RuvX [Prevotellaceae bacterium]|jgi:putative Holliday junction resolvase|nr:Holliday junction resolvase RuvX [Prevotellaceae bacterium]